MSNEDPRIIRYTLVEMAKLLSRWLPSGGPQHPYGGDLRSWGEPVNFPVPPQPDEPPGAGNPAWGRSDDVQLGSDAAKHTFVLINLPEARAVTITSNVVTFPNPNTYGDLTFYPWVALEWGNGSTTVKRAYRADDYFSITVTGSYIRVVAYLGDILGAQIAASQLSASAALAPSARFNVFAAHHDRSCLFPAVRWASNITAPAVKGVLTTIPRQMVSYHAHLQATGSAPNFLQLFDQITAPGAGAVPLVEYVVDSAVTQPDVVTQFPPRQFSQGIAYGFSSTSGTFTAAAAGVVEIAVVDI